MAKIKNYSNINEHKYFYTYYILGLPDCTFFRLVIYYTFKFSPYDDFLCFLNTSDLIISRISQFRFSVRIKISLFTTKNLTGTKTELYLSPCYPLHHFNVR